MNSRILLRVLGLLVLLLSGSMFACELYALVGDRALSGGKHDFALLKGAASALGIGLALLYFGRGAGDEILRKDAIAIVGLGWLASAAIGAIPYLYSTPSLDAASAIFESASGFTTTGASAISDLDKFPRPILLWRATTQWLGGMGILVLFVALLSTLGVGSKSIFQHESSAKSGYGFHSRIRQTAARLWIIYAALTAICVAGLAFMGMPVFDAILHAFAAISTGGFSPKNSSVAFYDSAAIDAWLCIFMTFGGASFLLLAWITRGGWNHVKRDEELRLYLTLLAAGSLVVAADLVARCSVPPLHALRLASFQVVSIMTTTGFVTADYETWPMLSKALLVLLMFVGGCAGSTSGGIKVSRVAIFFKSAGQQIRNSFRPSQHIPVRLNGERLDGEAVSRALFFISLAAFAVALSTLAVTLLEPQLDHVSSFTAVVSSLFNIGPGLGEVGPTKNFAFFTSASKLLLSLVMILGRLEFFGILALFLPSLWRRY